MFSTKSITRTTVLLTFVLWLSTIALPQGLDSRSFDTLPRRNGVPKGEGVATSRTAAQPICPAYGKPLTTLDANSGNASRSFSLGHFPGGEIRPLRLHLSELSPESYTPAALGDGAADGAGPGYESIKTEPVSYGARALLRQIKTPEVFVDVVTLSEWEFDIRFYRPESAGPIKNGVHTVIGIPFVTWKVKNPDPPSTNRIQVIKNEYSVSETTEAAYDAATDSWTMTNDKGEVTGSRTSTINPEDPCERTEVCMQLEAGSCLCKTTKVYRGFPWGQEIVRITEESNGKSETTTYAYYQNPAEQDRYRQVQTITFPDGSWEKYDYHQKDRFSSLEKRVIATGGPESKPQN